MLSVKMCAIVVSHLNLEKTWIVSLTYLDNIHIEEQKRWKYVIAMSPNQILRSTSCIT